MYRQPQRRQKIRLPPSELGIGPALSLSTFSHVVTGLFFVLAGWASGAGLVYLGVCLTVAVILLFEHRLISEQDMSRVNLAFFTMNGFVAVFLFAGAVLDTTLGSFLS